MADVQENFQLETKTIGALPIVNQFLERLRIQEFLREYLGKPDPRCAIAPERVLMLLVRSLIVQRQPLYALGEWAGGMMPSVLGLNRAELGKLNDDRIGRALDRLFDADRLAMLTKLVLHLIETFEVEMDELHNDSTTLTLHGQYREADGRPMRAKATIQADRGHNKDHRPDLKQLLWILTISSDGGVPVHFRVSAGHTEDSSTHIQTWNALRDLVGGSDFLYVADSKLCTRENMRHIDDRGGRFITVLPRSRKEDGWFRRWLVDHTPPWEPVAEFPHPRWDGGPPNIILAMESPIAEADGFRIVWIFSSHKLQRDAQWRLDCLEKATQQLESFRARLEGPRCRFSTRKRVTDQVDAILAETQTTAYISYTVTQHNEIKYHTVRKGNLVRKYRRGVKSRYRLEWTHNAAELREASKSDGVYPLITNCVEYSALDLYTAYRTKQPIVEKRHDLLKNTLEATPAYLQNIGRLEALLFLEFIALVVHALIERQMRHAMEAHHIKGLPLYPEDRTCTAPTTARLFELFGPLQCHGLIRHGTLVQEFPAELSPLQETMAQLAGISPQVYQSIRIRQQTAPKS
jgi:transposase